MIKIVIGGFLMIAYCVMLAQGTPQYFLSPFWLTLLSTAVGILAGTVFTFGLLDMLDWSTEQ